MSTEKALAGCFVLWVVMFFGVILLDIIDGITSGISHNDKPPV